MSMLITNIWASVGNFGPAIMFGAITVLMMVRMIVFDYFEWNDRK